MGSPTITRFGAGFKLVWSDDPVAILVDRIRESSDFAVSAEITISTTSPGVSPHLHQARLNLTSTTARNSLAKHLGEGYSSGIAPWPLVMEQLAAMVLRELREGEQLYQVSAITPSEGIKYRVNPFLLEGQPTLIYGEGGAAKSAFGMYLSLLVAIPVLQQGCDVEPGAVLYLDYETDPGDFQRRIAEMSAGLGFPIPHSLYYRRCVQPLAADASAIQRMIAEKEISVLIVDSAGLACGGQPQDESLVIPYFGALRQIGITSLTIGHVAKNAEHKTPFGSVYWTNMPRSVYEVKKVQNEDEDELMIGLYHRKVNMGKLQKPHGFKFAFSPEHVTVTRTMVEAVPELASQMSLRSRMVESLRHGPKTARAIANELEDSLPQIQARLSEQKGRTFSIVRVENREIFWGLLAH